MFNTWRFSKSTSLTLAVTTVAGAFVLAFAYHLHHYTEILSGVIGGLTIILGMVIAEWLRSTREQSEKTIERLTILATNFQFVIFNASVFLEESLTYDYKEQYLAIMNLQIELGNFELFYRWPQPNAKEVRKEARELGSRVFAMLRDAVENEHLWSTEKRFQLNEDFHKLFGLVQGVSKSEQVEGMRNYLKYRETEVRPGMTLAWRRQAERERQIKE